MSHMMNIKDPIQSVENIVKEVHDTTSKYTEPVLARYPLLFAFLVIFSASMIMKGFEKMMSKVTFLQEHPVLLLLTGVVLLTFTGSLYKWLNKGAKY